MAWSERRLKLLDFVKAMHGKQMRKYPEGVPYYKHCLEVARTVSCYVGIDSLGCEAAFCHDLFEDTECGVKELEDALIIAGYDCDERDEIIFLVEQLTDNYTSKAFPNMNREARKQAEAERLWSIHDLAKSIKYADLIDNTKSIVKYDKGFAKVYLPEKRRILSFMTGGNPDLYIECCYLLRKGELELENGKD